MSSLRGQSRRPRDSGTPPAFGSQDELHDTGTSTSNRKLARGFSLNLVGGIASAGLGFAFTVLVTHALPVAEVGVFFEVVAIFSILIVVAQLGASGTIVKTVSEYRAVGRVLAVPHAIRAALVPTAVFSIALAIALFAFAPLLATELVNNGNRQHAADYLRTVAPFVPFGALLAIVLAATRGAGTMVPTVLLDSIAKPALRVLVAIIALFVALSPFALGALWAAPLAIGFALAGLALLRLARRMQLESTSLGQPPTRRQSVMREYWAFTAPQWLAEVFQLAVLWIDVVLVGALASARDAGVYAAISRLATVGTLGLTAVLLVLGPEFSALLTLGNLDHVQSLYRRATLWLAASSVPIFVLSATFAPVIVRIFGSGYESGAKALAILSVAMLIAVVTGPSSLTLLMGGRTGLLLGNATAAFITNIGLNMVLIPLFGMTGAAIAWSVSIVLGNFLPVVQIRRIWGIRSVDQNLTIICIGAAVCFGIVGVAGARLGGSNVLTLLVSATIGTLLYTVMLWWMRTRLELRSLLTALRSSAS